MSLYCCSIAWAAVFFAIVAMQHFVCNLIANTRRRHFFGLFVGWRDGSTQKVDKYWTSFVSMEVYSCMPSAQMELRSLFF